MFINSTKNTIQQRAFVLTGLLFCATGCSPVYTWSYANTVHPIATSAYIRAVMARERGDYTLAIAYYDLALKYTDSSDVRAERDEVVQKLE